MSQHEVAVALRRSLAKDVASHLPWRYLHCNADTSLPASSIIEMSTSATWFSNGLCGLATGTGFTIRSLGSDDEESILVAERPIMLDGIDNFVVEPDLADRSFFLHVPPISRRTRRTEEAFWAAFDGDWPKMHGGLLDAVSAGMQMLPNVRLKEMSRMADAERWGEAVVRGLGGPPGTFTDALEANRAVACSSALEDSRLADAVVRRLKSDGPFAGMMVDLLDVFANDRPRQAASSDWPTTPRALSCKLRRLAPQLRTIGIDVRFDRIGNKRIVTIDAQSTYTPLGQE